MQPRSSKAEGCRASGSAVCVSRPMARAPALVSGSRRRSPRPCRPTSSQSREPERIQTEIGVQWLWELDGDPPGAYSMQPTPRSLSLTNLFSSAVALGAMRALLAQPKAKRDMTSCSAHKLEVTIEHGGLASQLGQWTVVSVPSVSRTFKHIYCKIYIRIQTSDQSSLNKVQYRVKVYQHQARPSRCCSYMLRAALVVL